MAGHFFPPQLLLQWQHLLTVQMFGNPLLEVFQFDLPFDIHLRITSNWNLAENRVTEIDVYVQHLWISWVVEGRHAVFPETCRRNMRTLKTSSLLGYPARLNVHLVPPPTPKLTYCRLTKKVSATPPTMLRITLFLWQCNCHLLDLNVHLHPWPKEYLMLFLLPHSTKYMEWGISVLLAFPFIIGVITTTLAQATEEGKCRELIIIIYVTPDTT